MYTYICTHVAAAAEYACVCVYTRISVYMCIHVCMHIRICIYVYIYTYMHRAQRLVPLLDTPVYVMLHRIMGWLRLVGSLKL